jgi:hypothetical protein
MYIYIYLINYLFYLINYLFYFTKLSIYDKRFTRHSLKRNGVFETYTNEQRDNTQTILHTRSARKEHRMQSQAYASTRTVTHAYTHTNEANRWSFCESTAKARNYDKPVFGYRTVRSTVAYLHKIIAKARWTRPPPEG